MHSQRVWCTCGVVEHYMPNEAWTIVSSSTGLTICQAFSCVQYLCTRRPQYLHSVEHPLWRCHHIFFLICWMHGLDRCQNYDKLMLMLYEMWINIEKPDSKMIINVGRMFDMKKNSREDRSSPTQDKLTAGNGGWRSLLLPSKHLDKLSRDLVMVVRRKTNVFLVRLMIVHLQGGLDNSEIYLFEKTVSS